MMKALVSKALRLSIISKMGQETMYNYIVFETKESCGIKLEQRLKNKAVEKASVKGDFHKWQWTYKREHQCMTMACRLRAEMDDQGKSLVSTL